MGSTVLNCKKCRVLTWIDLHKITKMLSLLASVSCLVSVCLFDVMIYCLIHFKRFAYLVNKMRDKWASDTVNITKVASSNTKTPDSEVMEPRSNWFRSWFPYLKWVPSSAKELKQAEENILNYVKTPSEGFYVNVGKINNKDCYIWTRKFLPVNKTSDTPLVMIHGMGAGLAMFALNIDKFCENSEVYALDLPGFARSSRPDFSSDPAVAEEQFLECLEEWRKSLNLNKINLLGHSFGGYLTASYSIKHPEHLENIILVDPWGMSEKPTDIQQKHKIPLWARGVFTVVKHFNPLAAFRVAGPAAPSLVQRLRPDIMRKYEGLIEEENLDLIAKYLFHCNAHHPSGESAFNTMITGMAWAKKPMFFWKNATVEALCMNKLVTIFSMTTGMAWAKNAMLPRIRNTRSTVPLTIIFGGDSWVSAIDEESFKNEEDRQIDVHVLDNAGHHVYADQCHQFNSIITDLISK